MFVCCNTGKSKPLGFWLRGFVYLKPPKLSHFNMILIIFVSMAKKIDIVNKHYDALYALYDSGLIPYHILIWKMVYDKHTILKKTSQSKPVLRLSKEFGYTQGHIHYILDSMNDEV